MSLASGRQRAFTLIELLIVITIIGILAVSLLPRLMGGTALARDASRKADLNQIATALEFYYSSNGGYPASPGCVSAMTSALGGSFAGGSIPSDPQGLNGNLGTTTACSTANGYTYYALAVSGGKATSYILSARLETAGDNGANVYSRAGFTISTAVSATSNFNTNSGQLCATLSGSGSACNSGTNTAAFVIGR